MKFLIITNHSYMLWRFRKELIMRLQESGDVSISTPFTGHEDDFMSLGCKCIKTDIDRRSINPIDDLHLLFNYRKLLKREKPDMVITYSIKPNIYAAYLCRLNKIPYCVNVQGLGTAFQKKFISDIVTFMYRCALKKSQTVFFENDDNLDEFLRRKIVKESQAVLLPGAGVNTQEYPETPYPDEADGIRFLYLGRIMKEKGIDELFEAAVKLKEKYGEKFKLDLVGFFEDEYKARVEELEKQGIVKFHGFQADPIPFYRKAHCVVLPSYHEGMSNVNLEAASIGRAVITSDIPGCREAVDDGVTGFLCERKNAAQLTDCMERFMNMSPEEREAMGKAGRRKVIAEFEKGMVVDQTVSEILKESIKN